MTTNQTYKTLVKQLPKELFKQYFNESFDYSPYQCIHTNEYDYYPELNCVIINDIAIMWETNTKDTQPVNLQNPAHLAELQRRAKKRFTPTLAIISVSTTNKRIDCQLYKNDERTQKFIHERKLSYVSFDEGPIYYDPNDINLANNPDMLLLAKCMFLAKKYKSIYIIPYKNTNPQEWETGTFAGGTNNE